MRALTNLLLACAVLVDAAPRAARSQAPTTVRAGDAIVDGRKLPLGVLEMVGMLRDSAGAPSRAVGRSRDEVVATTHNGRPALLRVLRVEQAATAKVPAINSLDSVLLDRATLAPIWRHSHNGPRVVLTDFDGARVRGQSGQGDQLRPISFDGEVAAFDDLTSDYVLAALPLREGAHYRVPVFQHSDNSVAWMEVAVTRAAGIPGSRDAYAMNIAQRGNTFVWYVDGETRRQLGARYALSAGGEMRVTLRR